MFSKKSFSTLAIVLFVFTIFRGIQLPRSWAQTHFLFNYDYGLVKRGFVGEVLQSIFGDIAFHSAFINVCIYILLLANLILLGRRIRDMTQAKSSDVLKASTFIYLAGLGIVGMSHTLGFLEHFGFLFALILLNIKSYNRRLVLAFVLFGLGILIHEANFVIFFPIVFMSFLLQKSKNWVAPVVLGIVMTLGTYAIVESPLPRKVVMELKKEVTAKSNLTFYDSAFEVLHRGSESNKRMMDARYGSKDKRSQMIFSLLVIAPSLIYFLYYIWLTLSINGYSVFIRCLSCIAPLSPLLLFGIAWDFTRWATLALTTSFFVFFSIKNHAKTTKYPPINTQFFLLIFFISAISYIPLLKGYMDFFPFAHHLLPIIDLFH